MDRESSDMDINIMIKGSVDHKKIFEKINDLHVKHFIIREMSMKKN
jgi:hypothetical protein